MRISKKRIVFSVFLLACLMAQSGCSTVASQKRKEAMEEKAKKYDDLVAAVTAKKLKENTPSDIVREKYGPPDDIFGSGSVSGRFEVWTYERPLAKEGEWHRVTLYFNNNRLISWDY